MSMRRIYRRIAKENKVSLSEVRTEIQIAVEVAYKNTPNDGGVIAAYQRRVPRRGEIPTPEEVICYVAGQVQGNRGGVR